jgi:peptidoglycan hydrolase CwlO-like protein
LLARSHRSTLLLAVLAGFLLVLLEPAAGPAQSPGVGVLQQQQASLAAQEQAAVVQLYGLESRLAQARSDLAKADAQKTALEHEAAVARQELAAARKTTRNSQRRLADQLRYLYEQGEPDTIAIILGAHSLGDAIDALEAAKQTARASQTVLRTANRAQKKVKQTQAKLAQQVRAAQAARDRFAASAADLEQARSERTGFIASLRQQQALNAQQIRQAQV